MLPLPLGCRRALTLVVTTYCLLLAAPAATQPAESIGPVVVDARGALAIYGQNPTIASTRGILESTLPARGLGVSVGAHWYPIRWKAITFGIGGEFVAARGEAVAADATEGLPETVRIAFTSFTPQVSLNFGTGRGWSYLSGGLGSTTFRVSGDRIAETSADPKPKTLNYGGGARWFNRKHLALSVDLRFYAMSPVAETAEVPPTPRMTLLVVNVGVSFK